MSYTIVKEIGRGGMGCVYKAQDSNGSMVALKMMSNKVTCYPEYRQLFQAEVDTLKRMDYPSVVHIVGDPYNDSEGNLYLPMEYVEGETIEHAVNYNGVFSAEKAIDLMIQILDALQYVHSRNVIHRDMKPSNIMIRPNGKICIIDFGIAKDAKIGSGHTVGRVIGTDGYMSPEQANGLNIDSRTDIYSLGCVFYFLLTGKHAIPKGQNDYETVCNVLKSIPLLPSQSGNGVSSALDDVFIKAVDKNMTQRYQTAREFKEALELAVGLNVPSVSIGRGIENDIVVDHMDVSRKHLIITGMSVPLTGGRENFILEITDVGSTNGTGINGRLLRNDTVSIDYVGTLNLPEILLAGKPELSINWKEVMSVLREKGWSPVYEDEITSPPPFSPEPEQNLSVVLCIISLIVPIIGWVLWGVYRHDSPRKAKKAALFGWIGFVINIIIYSINNLS